MSGGADGRGSRKCAGMVRVYCRDNIAHACVVTGRIPRRDLGDANDGWDVVTTV